MAHVLPPSLEKSGKTALAKPLTGTPSLSARTSNKSTATSAVQTSKWNRETRTSATRPLPRRRGVYSGVKVSCVHTVTLDMSVPTVPVELSYGYKKMLNVAVVPLRAERGSQSVLRRYRPGPQAASSSGQYITAPRLKNGPTSLSACALMSLYKRFVLSIMICKGNPDDV